VVLKGVLVAMGSLSAFALLGCKGAPADATSNRADDAPADPIAMPAPSGAAVADASVDPISACATVMRRSVDQAKGGLQPGERLVGNADIQRACAPIYKEAACRSAVERAADASTFPATTTAFTACRDAYCPKLVDPKPAACSAATVSASEWGDLFAAIVRHDHGDRGEPILESIGQGRVTVRVR
jgi:hypothetical protein